MKHTLYIFLLIQSLTCLYVRGADEDGPEVEIQQGLLKGKYWKTRQGRRFSAFLGIPFATPPVGELRFKAPLPAEPWQGILDATKSHAVCPQRNTYIRSDVISGEEDCLYLNVYTPQLPSFGSDPLPVMLFFHGGGWLCGDGGHMSYGPAILLDRDVVLVVTNYRLGALGFLSTEDEVVPGNNGMKDQSLALKWVKQNIGLFGGDSNSITIFGESAGGVSSQLHMFSSLSQGLFNRAISHSGTAFSIWGVAPKNEGIENAKLLARGLDCPTTSTKEMVDCLRKIKAHKIVERDRDFMKWDLEPMIPFKPVVEPDLEGAFLSKHPVDLIKSGQYADIPWMTGINTEEGALRVAAFRERPHLYSDIHSEFNRVIPITMMYDKVASNIDHVTKQIREFYFGGNKIDDSMTQQLTHLYTDSWFLSGADLAVRLHRKYSEQPVYYYLFGHRGVASFSELFGGTAEDYGVCHVDELQYLFPIGDMLFPDKKPDENDKRVAEIMTTLWTNFAKTGDPTPEVNLLIPEKWKPVQSNAMEYYFIGNNGNLQMEEGLLLERAKFWRSLPIEPEKYDIHDEL